MTIFKKISHWGVGAMTLTELLVSVVLIGIVMLGMVSIDYATKQSQQTTTRLGLVAIRTGAMMLNISKALSLATGDKTNVGIKASAAASPFNGPTDLCVRQDLNGLETPNNTPNDLTDDTWRCYTTFLRQLFACRLPAANACATILLPNTNYVGPLYSLTVSVVTNTTVGTESFYVEITLTNRYTPTAATDPLNNPDYILQSRVYPGAHSWSIP